MIIGETPNLDALEYAVAIRPQLKDSKDPKIVGGALFILNLQREGLLQHSDIQGIEALAFICAQYVRAKYRIK